MMKFMPTPKSLEGVCRIGILVMERHLLKYAQMIVKFITIVFQPQQSIIASFPVELANLKYFSRSFNRIHLIAHSFVPNEGYALLLGLDPSCLVI